jgi:predicted dehydrogenase
MHISLSCNNQHQHTGVPHSGHFDLVKLALNHGKHVLCEKPFTVNANEAKVLFDMAKEKNLFVMEAMWTRFLPVTQYISDLVKGGTLGDVKVVYVQRFRFLFDQDTDTPQSC